ncbi:hypothetical protein [Pectobacterium brasiliense]|nr:hypothetical protein [Pectobacterium brasiliense]
MEKRLGLFLRQETFPVNISNLLSRNETGAILRMFTTAIKQGDVIQVVMASSGFHSSSDISVSLSQ